MDQWIAGARCGGEVDGSGRWQEMAGGGGGDCARSLLVCCFVVCVAVEKREAGGNEAIIALRWQYTYICMVLRCCTTSVNVGQQLLSGNVAGAGAIASVMVLAAAVAQRYCSVAAL